MAGFDLHSSLGGGGEIRTHDTLSGIPHFECGAFGHSATPPPRLESISIFLRDACPFLTRLWHAFFAVEFIVNLRYLQVVCPRSSMDRTTHS